MTSLIAAEAMSLAGKQVSSVTPDISTKSGQKSVLGLIVLVILLLLGVWLYFNWKKANTTERRPVA